MNPYLERHWLDLHARLVTYGSDELNQRLPADLIARVEERMAVESDSSEPGGGGVRRQLAPDVRVFESVEEEGGVAVATSEAALAPYRLVLLDDPVTERFIRIIDLRGGERLVAAIEFVSPTNKTGRGIDAFVSKRDELLEGGANFVEIDLVRSGNWRRLLEPHRCPNEAIAAYRAVIRLSKESLVAYVHPLSLRQPLPAIKIPLRDNEPPCELPLQPLIEMAYINGRYDRTLDYRQPCEPPLDDDDAAWADELLRAAGRR